MFGRHRMKQMQESIERLRADVDRARQESSEALTKVGLLLDHFGLVTDNGRWQHTGSRLRPKQIDQSGELR